MRTGMTGSLFRRRGRRLRTRGLGRATRGRSEIALSAIHLEDFLKTLAALLLCIAFAVMPSLAADSYKITKKIPVPGQGGWDYLIVDDGARRLYVSHGTQVEVLDVDSGNVVGKIENTPGVHGIAIAPDLGQGFVSN